MTDTPPIWFTNWVNDEFRPTMNRIIKHSNNFEQSTLKRKRTSENCVHKKIKFQIEKLMCEECDVKPQLGPCSRCTRKICGNCALTTLEIHADNCSLDPDLCEDCSLYYMSYYMNLKKGGVKNYDIG